MTLATKITVARIVLIVPTVAFYILAMLLEGLYLPFLILSCVLFAILCSTDFVDGHIARKTHTVSDLGKFLDPLADKIVIVVMLFLIVYFRDFTLFPYDGLVIALLGGLILTRELTVSVFRAVAAKKGMVLAADIYGKIKTVLLDVGVAFLIVAGTHIVIVWIGEIVFYAGAILTVVSGLNYILKNKRVLDDSVKSVNVGGESSRSAAEEEKETDVKESGRTAANCDDVPRLPYKQHIDECGGKSALIDETRPCGYGRESSFVRTIILTPSFGTHEENTGKPLAVEGSVAEPVVSPAATPESSEDFAQSAVHEVIVTPEPVQIAEDSVEEHAERSVSEAYGEEIFSADTPEESDADAAEDSCVEEPPVTDIVRDMNESDSADEYVPVSAEGAAEEDSVEDEEEESVVENDVDGYESESDDGYSESVSEDTESDDDDGYREEYTTPVAEERELQDGLSEDDATFVADETYDVSCDDEEYGEEEAPSNVAPTADDDSDVGAETADDDSDVGAETADDDSQYSEEESVATYDNEDAEGEGSGVTNAEGISQAEEAFAEDEPDEDSADVAEDADVRNDSFEEDSFSDDFFDEPPFDIDGAKEQEEVGARNVYGFADADDGDTDLGEDVPKEFFDVARLALEGTLISIPVIQRATGLGFSQAAKIFDVMKANKLIVFDDESGKYVADFDEKDLERMESRFGAGEDGDR